MRRAGRVLALAGAIVLWAGALQANQARLPDVCYRAVLDAATAYALGGILREAGDERTGHPGVAGRLQAIQDELTQQMGAALDAGCPSGPFEQLVACFQSRSDGSGRNVPKASACVEEVTGRRDDPGPGMR